MEIQNQLDHLEATVRGAKAMPMSAACLVNRGEMFEIIERLRIELPANIDHADALLAERDAVLAAAREQAERIVAGARGEREQLIEQADVLVAARARAGTVTTQARDESTRLLADADDYVDRKLADFEAVLGQLGSQVNNGRLRLTTRREADLARFRGMVEEDEEIPAALDESVVPADPSVPADQGTLATGVSLGAR
jgi:cell division septum initiation protein DivIVA